MSIFSEIIGELKYNVAFRKRLMPAQKQLDTHAPRAGDMAPDFKLVDLDGQNPVMLSSFRGKKPVALVFGSFT